MQRSSSKALSAEEWQNVYLSGCSHPQTNLASTVKQQHIMVKVELAKRQEEEGRGGEGGRCYFTV